jgi:hypothetical protein
MGVLGPHGPEVPHKKFDEKMFSQLPVQFNISQLLRTHHTNVLESSISSAFTDYTSSFYKFKINFQIFEYYWQLVRMVEWGIGSPQDPYRNRTV